MIKLHIGFDDTDSPRFGCTTYIAALVIEKIRKLGVFFIDYPNLIRLNPNVPWKTRGNGALCLRTLCEEEKFEDVKESVIEVIEENSDLDYEGTDPGVVFLTGDVPEEIKAFAEKAITGIVEKGEALRLMKKYRVEAVGFKKSRGIIGGLAGIGEQLRADHTYEFIAYRRRENWGRPRRVDSSSVIEMSKQLGIMSFNNVDPETKRILITPRGPDPILYGIRGETPEIVRQGHSLVVSNEPIERWVIFRTNQGTDAHLKKVFSVKDVRPYNPIVLRGEVADKPRVIAGGHIIFQLRDESGMIDCAAYEPTGDLKCAVRMLTAGDVVEVYGGVRAASSNNPLTVNLEKIRIIKLAPAFILRNPSCLVCGKRMKSMGRGQGFECKKCGFHGRNLKKIVEEIERPIKHGLYITSPRSQRHLTKPLTRYGLEKWGISEKIGKVLPYELFCGVSTV